MTTYNKATLKTFFESGDVPQGGDYANLIDSYVNIVDTAAQSMAGTLVTPELTTAYISATNVRITGTLSANNLAINGVVLSAGAITGTSLGVLHDVSAGGNITASAGTFSSSLTAASLQISGIVSANALHCSAARVDDGVKMSVTVVSAAGTAQGTATPVSGAVSNLQGVTDGSTTGFILTANNGRVSFIVNNTAVSANLYPPSGGTINALGANAPFPLAARTPYTVFPLSGTSFFVK